MSRLPPPASATSQCQVQNPISRYGTLANTLSRLSSEFRIFHRRSGLSGRSAPIPQGAIAAGQQREDLIRWHKILAAKGWSVSSWPKQFGGTGWSAIQQHIFEEECADAGAPPLLAFSVRMVAPVIMHFGNKQQQEYFLPKIASG